MNGVIDINNVQSGYGILNVDPGVFTNRGMITMVTVDLVNLRNLSAFINEGDIELLDITTSGILNKDAFTNHESGIILLENGNHGIINNPNATFDNQGGITVDITNYGLVNKGTFTNNDIASLLISNGIQAITNRNISGAGNGEFYNYNSVTIGLCTTGLRNEDFVVNEGYLNIDFSNYIGAKNISGTIENYKTMTLNGTHQSLVNQAEFINSDKGYFFVANIIKNETVNGYIENNGYLISEGQTVHDLDANSVLVNYAVVEDHGNTFSGIGFDNQQVYVHKIVGPLEDGGVYSDILDVASSSNIDFQEWFDYILIPYPEDVGIYDEGLNEFTANSYVEGLDIIYIETYLLSSGKGRNINLHVDNSSSSSISPFINQTETLTSGHENKDIDIKIYPNPVVDYIEIICPPARDKSVDIQVCNSIGQNILKKTLSKGEVNSKLNFPSDLSGGLYTVLMTQDNVLISEKQVVLNR